MNLYQTTFKDWLWVLTWWYVTAEYNLPIHHTTLAQMQIYQQQSKNSNTYGDNKLFKLAAFYHFGSAFQHEIRALTLHGDRFDQPWTQLYDLDEEWQFTRSGGVSWWPDLAGVKKKHCCHGRLQFAMVMSAGNVALEPLFQLGGRARGS